MFYAKKGHVDLVLKNALPPIGGRKGQGYNCFVCHKPQHKMQTYKVRNKKIKWPPITDGHLKKIITVNSALDS